MQDKKIISHPNTQSIITTENLSIIFNEKADKTVVLENFNFSFEKGKIYAIIGNSGSGKTSLITHLNGLLKSKHGDILVDKYPILGKQIFVHKVKKIRKFCGLVTQFPEYQLFRDTIEKDIIFGPMNFGLKKKAAKNVARKYISLVGLDQSFLPRSPFALSGGQKRRVAIAGVLSIEPNVIMFDEPTAGLDPSGEQEMVSIMQNLKKEGKTIILVTHVMDHVLELADEVIVLHNKGVLLHGSTYDVFTNQNVLKTTTIAAPNVIRTIELLAEQDERFKKLWKTQPKTVEMLGTHINKILGREE